MLCGTAPKALILSTEPAGSESAKAMGSKNDDLYVETWEDFLTTTTWLEKGGYREFDWICLDGITELEEHAWNAIMGEGGSARSVGGSFRARSRNDYPLVWDAMKTVIGRYNRMPVNVLFTAHTMRVDVETDEGEDTTLSMPMVGSTKRGDLSMKVCGLMTMVGYYRETINSETGKKVRRLHTIGGERWVAKDRHDAFGRYVVKPNIATMQQAAQERLKNGTGTGTKKRTAKKEI